jgi:hypothetical protein
LLLVRDLVIRAGNHPIGQAQSLRTGNALPEKRPREQENSEKPEHRHVVGRVFLDARRASELLVEVVLRRTSRLPVHDSPPWQDNQRPFICVDMLRLLRLDALKASTIRDGLARTGLSARRSTKRKPVKTLAATLLP